ncbi:MULTISPECIES: MbtH family protein [unclassified Micromonospora]|uniref:MbtH family protein n=1 Tax=unclassified Micromonospora TaxID=2617518 RepID=UPI0036373EA3
MPHAFDDEDASFLVLLNHARQYSLWPAYADPPTSWTVAAGPAPHAECLAYVEQHWTDLRPEGSGAPR